MKLKKQVTSLKLSRKLKELGVKQDSLFKWERSCSNGLDGWNIIYSQNKEQVYSAFTVAELGEMLPNSIPHLGLTIHKLTRTDTDNWFIAYTDYMSGVVRGEQRAKKEADARAKLLIYLIENDLYDV